MTIVVQDIAYVRYRVPDLERMQTFLQDFGLTSVRRTDDALYMRGVGPEPFVHVTERSESASLGFGLKAASLEDLQKLAVRFGVGVSDSPEPGGGQRVTLVDPDGFRVDVVHGAKQLPPLPAPASAPLNYSGARQRLNGKQRFESGPSHVVRLGHVVIKVRDFRVSHDFYSTVFGMRAADSFYAGDPDNTIMAFMRCGLGKTYTDHHTLGILQDSSAPGFEHSAFEVIDWDDLCVGNNHLVKAGHLHSWGIGRHVAGSQVFDYWRDPFGNKVEHWTDGDQVNDDYQSTHAAINPDALSQWAPPIHPDYFT